MFYPIEIINKANIQKYQFITHIWKLKNTKNTQFSLIIKPNRIELRNNLKPKFKNIWINFSYQKFQKYKKDKNIKMLQAIKIKKNYSPHILDITAGVGKDAFIFFSFGYTVTMVEKNPILSILLYDGLYRGFQDNKIGHILKKKMKLIYNNSMNIKLFKILPQDIIYFDPMFPDKKKTALSKKDIYTIRQLVKNDVDDINLFKICQSCIKNRMIIKRPYQSQYISNMIPNFNIKTKKHRFDIYLKKNIK